MSWRVARRLSACGLAAGLGQRLGEVGEEDRDQEQDGQRRLVDDQAGGRVVEDRLDGDDRGQDGADLDQEHDRVAHHVPRVEHDERPPGGHADQRRLEQPEVPRVAALDLEGLGFGGGPRGRPDLGIKAHRVHSCKAESRDRQCGDVVVTIPGVEAPAGRPAARPCSPLSRGTAATVPRPGTRPVPAPRAA